MGNRSVGRARWHTLCVCAPSMAKRRDLKLAAFLGINDRIGAALCARQARPALRSPS
jgi:hypothetical protein